MNPYTAFDIALRELDDAMRRAASVAPRDDPAWSALFNCVRALERAAVAQYRITQYRTTGEC